MTVRRHPLDLALTQIPTLTERLRHTHPDQAADLDRIEHAAAQLAHWLPRARAITARGDGLRSPSLQPHRGSGGHGDPVAALVEADWGDTGRTKRGHAGRLDQAADHVRTAHQDLTRAAQGARPPNRPQPPPEAVAGQERDVSGQCGEMVSDARHGLDRALGLVQQVLPKAYDRAKLRLADPPACRNCRDHGHHADAAADRGGLCWWCSDVRRAFADLPDADLMEHHKAGRVSKRAYDEFEARTRKRRAKARAKAKAARR
ncbi:MAG: hypothetical protein WKF86_00080 [Acidimicrobiales bacterium]